MIHEKAIFIKLNQLQISDQTLFDAAIAGFRPSECTCPKCNAMGRFVPTQLYYEREMISIDKGKRVQTTLTIPRYLCESCGSTHAFLPDVLIPFGSYSLRFVLFILKTYKNRTCTVAELCMNWEIAISTLYGWIHLFIDHHNAWCNILDRILWVSDEAIQTISSIPAFPSEFFLRFRRVFLQWKKTTLSGCHPPKDRRYRQPPT